MEIIKQNETFNVKDSNEKFEMSGSVSRDISGSLNIYFNVNHLEGNRVGEVRYNKYVESGDVNFGVTCSEANRDELSAYADATVDYILEYLNGSN